MRDQAARLRELAGGSRKGPVEIGGGNAAVIAVASGKGGVGKTSVVANLGFALAKRGAKVLALDADFGLANLDILLNLAPAKNLGHLIRGEASAKEVVVAASPGFSVIPGASGIQRLADMDSSDRMRIVEALAGLASEYDVVLIDASAGIGRSVVDICLAADEVLLVTDPQPTSLTDAYGLAKVLFQKSPKVRIRVLVNSSSGPEEGRAVWVKLNSVMKRFLSVESEYLGHVVRDESVSRAISMQKPFVEAYPGSPASACIEEVADALGQGRSARRAGPSFWTRLAAEGGGI